MNDDLINFGSYISNKRKSLGITMAFVAEKAGISSVYLCDIEKNRRYAPDNHILEKIAEQLHMTPEEIDTMYDLAGKTKGVVPPDLPEYILEKDIVVAALRKAKKQGATDKDWEDFINRISK